MSGSSRGDRGAVLALGLILAAFVAIATITQPSGNPANRDERPSDQGQVESPSGDNIAYRVTGDFDPWRDPIPQWLMAIFSGLAVGVSIWAIIWIKRTWDQTKRTADATHIATNLAAEANRLAAENYIADRRAWLELSRPQFLADLKMQDVGPTITDLRFEAKNVGHSPAIDVTMMARLFPSRSGDTIDQYFGAFKDEILKHRGMGPVIFPGGTEGIVTGTHVNRSLVDDAVHGLYLYYGAAYRIVESGRYYLSANIWSLHYEPGSIVSRAVLSRGYILKGFAD